MVNTQSQERQRTNEHEVPPKFNLNVMDNVMVLTMNTEFADELLDLLDEFSDLDTYLFACRAQLKKHVDYKLGRR